MKKILLVVLALILVALPLTACDNNDDNKIIVNETTHSIFYAPQYLAMALGYFEEAGYEIELINGQGSDLSMTEVVTGAADIALLGPETVLYKVTSIGTKLKHLIGVNYDRRNFKEAQRTFR